MEAAPSFCFSSFSNQEPFARLLVAKFQWLASGPGNGELGGYVTADCPRQGSNPLAFVPYLGQGSNPGSNPALGKQLSAI